MTNNRKIAFAALLAALGLSEAAHAAGGFGLSPPNSAFTATGQGAVTGPQGSYACSVSMSGTTGAVTGSINSVTLSGAPGCENVMAKGLPWRIKAISKTKVQIFHFDLMYPGLGRCGPNQVSGVLAQGNLSIQDHVPSAQGVCKIDASLNTSPQLSIVSR